MKGSAGCRSGGSKGEEGAHDNIESESVSGFDLSS